MSDDIVEELRQRGADSTLIANNAYLRAADEIERLRGVTTDDGYLTLALARAEQLIDRLTEENAQLRVAAGILQKLAATAEIDWEGDTFVNNLDALTAAERAYLEGLTGSDENG